MLAARSAALQTRLGEFRVVSNRFISQQSFKPDGKRHEPCDPGNGEVSRFDTHVILVLADPCQRELPAR